MYEKRAGILGGPPISRQPSNKAREDIYATPIRGTDGNPTGSPSCPPECLYLVGHLEVVLVYGRVELGENDPTLVDTVNGDLVRCVRVFWVWSSMPVASKVDSAAVDVWTRDNKSWGGGQYNMDRITTYCLS